MRVIVRTYDGGLGWADMEAGRRRSAVDRPRHFVATTTAALIAALGVAGGATASAIGNNAASSKAVQGAQVQSDAAVKAAQIQADAQKTAADATAKSAAATLDFEKAQSQLTLDQYNAREARLTPYRNLGNFATGTPAITPTSLRDLSLAPTRTVVGGGDGSQSVTAAGGPPPQAVAQRAISPYAPVAPTVAQATPMLTMNDLVRTPPPLAMTAAAPAQTPIAAPSYASVAPPYLALRDFLMQRAS